MAIVDVDAPAHFLTADSHLLAQGGALSVSERPASAHRTPKDHSPIALNFETRSMEMSASCS